ncbi:4-hydroxybenzoate polyprenyltransferase [Alteromonadaceae bacterium Bs31]|nr:4-hydroxybenzoate polyprenyltransferase [Alteromonadaceae bacterium Bs31]
MKLSSALQLGRVSNLPTVWTNVLVGLAFVKATDSYTIIWAAMAALSLIYLAGMFLNDAFDADWDKQHKQNRPIVNGETTAKEVTVYACVFIILAMALLLGAARSGQALQVLVASALLIASIVIYDWKHKSWKHSAWIMGSCRLWVYFLAASLVASISTALCLAGLSLMFYIAGITYLARSEHMNSLQSTWPIVLLLSPVVLAIYFSFSSASPLISLLLVSALVHWLLKGALLLLPGKKRNIPQAIGILLSGMCLIDACFLYTLGAHMLTWLALLGFLLCLLLQKKIAAS